MLAALLAVCTLSESLAVAEVALASVFGDQMILQRDMPLQVWGTAEPGETVEVRVGNLRESIAADDAGKWLVTLPPQHASSVPVDFAVIASNRTTLSDVLVGEVWLCAGQSNMEWPLKQSTNAAGELTQADLPILRLLNLPGAARGGRGVYGPKHFARLEPAKFCQGHWARCNAKTAKEFSAVGYFFGKALQEAIEVPVGLISPAIGGTPAEAWVRRGALADDPQLASMVQGNWLENPVLDDWCRRRAKSNLSKALSSQADVPGDDLGPNHSFKPGFMWEAGIEPIVPLSVRGVLWYQGESNAESPRRVSQHRRIFETLITDWRKQWARPDLPFLFVQLPALGRPNWPAFRQTQLECLRSTSNTGMVVTIDTGHPTNVHPTDKRPVGERLAKIARGLVYQQPAHEAFSGPIINSVAAQESQVVLRFDHVGQGLASSDGQPLRHFEIAGADGQFVPATATIQNDEVVVRSDQVDSPRHVRYAWIAYPKPPVNFTNRSGLPASPFEVNVD